ncbi:MAG: M28 family peptidase [Pirellulaceae bacterium]
MNCCKTFFISFALVLVAATVALAQQSIEEVHADALGRITENSVEASISYLASDELGGRGTGTNEYLIAAAYVASRFKNAGLEGGGPNGSFYHEKEILLAKTPVAGIEFATASGVPLAHLGMFGGVDTDLTQSGTIDRIDIANVPEQLGAKIVAARFQSPTAQGRGRGGRNAIADSVAKLKAKGAEALILGVDANDPIVAVAAAQRETAGIVDPRTNLALPILLVDEKLLDSLSEVKLTLPKRVETRYMARNVVGLLKGTDPNLAPEAVLFSAHLDHLGRREGQVDPIYNGADDDASGVSAVLTLADAFGAAKARPARSVLFMTFWGEESGLLGSKDFADNPSWPLDKIVSNINIEMIGRPEAGASKKIWVTGWEKSDLGPIMNQSSQQIGITIFEHPKYSAMLYRSSDNWSLAQKGVIAHSFSAGSLHGDYHQPGDEWQKLDIEHMTNVIRGLYIGSLPLTNGIEKPTAANK